MKIQENIVKLICQTCKSINYWTRKNKKTAQKKLELKKYCPVCQKHVSHKEGK